MRWLILVALLLTGCVPANQPFSPLPQPADIALARYVYFPIMRLVPLPTTTPAPSCYATPQAREFVRLMAHDSRQQRAALLCSPALIRAAQVRGESLAKLGYFAHCDPDGVCPNAVARAEGCKLPTWYAVNGNNIESLIAGTDDTETAWRLLSGSPAHAAHLLGQNDFFRAQGDVGVAYVAVPGSKYSFYWVVLIAICGGS